MKTELHVEIAKLLNDRTLTASQIAEAVGVAQVSIYYRLTYMKNMGYFTVGTEELGNRNSKPGTQGGRTFYTLSGKGKRALAKKLAECADLVETPAEELYFDQHGLG